MNDFVQLKDLCKPIRSSLKNDDLIGHEGSFPVFGASGQIANVDFYQEEKPSIGIVKDGAGVGRVLFLPEKSSVLGTIQMVVPKANTDILYLYYLLKSLNLSDEANGATIPHIYFKKYGLKRVHSKTLDEQIKIGRELEKIEKIAHKATSFSSLCDEAIKARFVEMFGDPMNNTHKFPQGKIASIVKETHYGTSSPSNEGGKYIYLRMSNMTDDGKIDLTDTKRIDLNDSEIEKYSVKFGDVLFNRTNSADKVGKVCVFKEPSSMIIAGYIVRIRLKPSILSDYFSGMMNSVYGKSQLSKIIKPSIHQANINVNDMQKIEILVPPLALQKEYSDFLTRIDKLKFNLQKEIDLTNELLALKFHQYFDQEA